LDPRHALTCDDDELRGHVAGLTDEQLVAFLAAIDAVEQVERSKPLDLAASALFYAQRLNWPVFPLKPRGKTPLTRHGFKDATRDPTTIAQWWARWPDANVGTPTGADGCGYDVIDVDGRTGIASLVRLKHAHCPPDCTAEAFCDALGEIPTPLARAMTPGGDDGPGFHYFIPATGDGNTTALEPGIDYRGAGGYVVLCPSIGFNGNRYTWITRPPLPEVEG
jgi:hypothetical protein